jgi:6-phosphogluconolactonase (cycloisomerase 2 family)
MFLRSRNSFRPDENAVARRMSPKRKIGSGRILLILSAIALLLFSPIARAQSGNTVQYLFTVIVVNSSGAVQTFTVNPTTGALTAIAAPPAPLRTINGAVATVNQAGTFLFIGTPNSANNSAVAVCAIAPDGSVSEIAASPFSGSTSNSRPVAIAVSPDGKYLYLASNEGTPTTITTTVVDVFSVASDGSLAPLNSYSLPLIPQGLFLHPTGSWVYVLGEPNNTPRNSVVEQFTVGPPGTLTDKGPLALEEFSVTSSAIAGNEAGTFLFVTHGALGSNETFIDTLAVNPVDGTLSVLTIFDAGSSVPTTQPNAVVDSTGKFLFTTNGSYSIANGSLTLLQAMPPLTTVAVPLLLASPNTPFLFGAADLLEGHGRYISSDTIGTGGLLTPAPGSPYSEIFGTVGMAVTGSIPLPNQPTITLTPSTLPNFGSVVTGQTGSANFSIMNSGFATLTFNSIGISGDPGFSETNNCPATLAPAASCLVDLTFAPKTTGPFNASVVITSNAPTATVSLSGTGINPFPEPALTPQSMTFPDTAVGSKSASQSFTVLNGSGATAALVVSNIMFTGSNPGDFSETNNCTTPVAAGSSCTIAVTFSPLALGGRAAVVTIVTNGGTFGPSISGNGIPLPFTLQTSGPTSVTVQPNQPANYNLSFTPMATFSGTVTFSCVVVPAGPACNVVPSMVQVNAAQSPMSTPVKVTVTPRGAAGLGAGERLREFFLFDASGTRRASALAASSLLAIFGLAFLVWLASPRAGNGVAGSRLVRLSGAAIIVCTVGICCAMTACGGSGGSSMGPPPPQNFMVNVTATAGQASQTVNLSLTVQ